MLDNTPPLLRRKSVKAVRIKGALSHSLQTLPAVIQQCARFPFRLGIAWLSFIVLVVLPTIGTMAYLGLIATDEYVSEARLVIRSPSDDPIRQLSMDFMSLASAFGGPKSTSQDAHIVVGYVRGRSVIDDIGGKEAMQRIYSRKDIDWLSSLGPESSLEDIWKYWRRKVSAVLDVPSTIITINVRAFARQDAFDLATRLVSVAERLVNEISDRARTDTLYHAEAELREARQKVNERLEALAAYRNKQELLDPMMSASSISQTATSLLQEKFKIENQIAVLERSVSPDAPSMRTLRAQLSSVDEQLRTLEAQLASDAPGRRVLANQLAGYERIQLELKFAEKLYEIAESAYKKASLEAQRQQLYLVSVVRPTMPQEAQYPRPFLDGLLVFVWLAVLWAIVALIIAGIREHR